MIKSNRVVYWICTLWLFLGMISTGIVQVLKFKSQVAPSLEMGYPDYFLRILAVWKVLTVIAIVIPNFPLIRNEPLLASSFQCRNLCFGTWPSIMGSRT